MADRKAELERKKAKLQALREEKERRRMEKAQKDVSRTELPLYISENYITCSIRN
jgi:dynein intermediate chain